MTPSVRTLQGSKTKGFLGATSLALGGQMRAAFPGVKEGGRCPMPESMLGFMLGLMVGMVLGINKKTNS